MHILKNFLLIITIVGISLAVHAQQQNEFFDTLLISEEYAVKDEEKEASLDARAKLQQQKKKIDIGQDTKLKQIIQKQQKENKNQAQTRQNMERVSKLASAPFGLLWGATYEETLSSGVLLTRTEEKDYVNSFIATQLPKPLSDMRYVVVTFGEENTLWRIISYGKFIKDTPSASLILKEYHRFYDLLNKKYGHAEETYTPKLTQITKTVELENHQTKEETETVEEPIGNDNFLSQLQSGEADLYATFYNNEVGAALSINVDGNGNSYLILEYKNLKLFQGQQDKTLDAL